MDSVQRCFRSHDFGLKTSPSSQCLWNGAHIVSEDEHLVAASSTALFHVPRPGKIPLSWLAAICILPGCSLMMREKQRPSQGGNFYFYVAVILKRAAALSEEGWLITLCKCRHFLLLVIE